MNVFIATTDIGARLLPRLYSFTYQVVRIYLTTTNGLEGLLMTNSAKWTYYAPSMLPVQVVIGSLSECVELAVARKVELDQWASQ